MRRSISLSAGCALAGVALAVSVLPAQAAAAQFVTITFNLTIKGSVPSHDRFGVAGIVSLCSIPCIGGGHRYTATTQWLKDSPRVQFVFDRETLGANGTPSHEQEFAQQTVNPDRNRTISAVFTYQTAAPVSTPATGAAPPLGLGVLGIAAGVATLLLAAQRRTNELATGSSTY
jgi:hypothetical protein